MNLVKREILLLRHVPRSKGAKTYDVSNMFAFQSPIRTVPENAPHFFFGRLSYSPLQTSFMEAQNHIPHAGTLRSCHAHFVSPPRDITSPVTRMRTR